MGDYTHYYCFSDPLHSQFFITYGNAEEIDAPYEIDQTIFNAVAFGMQAGLREMADSPDEVLAAAAIGAAAGLGITLATATLPSTPVIAAIIGIICTIYEFCQDFKYICGIDGTYQKIREAAKLATIFIVTSVAAGIGAKIGQYEVTSHL